MYLFKANINLSDEYRKQEIKGNHYRPLLSFSNTVIRSGLIDLEDKPYLEMNKSYDDILFKIYFHEDLDVENEFFVGREFRILEGNTFIGSGIISKVIGIT
jgi:translation elongation factor EF-Tu-like GTPase